MAMTEKQGGSDVRANTTRAVPNADGSYSLTGHKWFCSAPMCDLFLVLAQTDGRGPELLPGAPGAARRHPQPVRPAAAEGQARQPLQRLLGGGVRRHRRWLVGEPGRGVRTIIEMVTMTRLDCVIGSAAVQRAALTQALHHIGGRAAFGAPLSDQPLMQEVVADLAVEVEAAAALFLRLAAAVDRGETAAALAVAAGKFWVCKRTAGGGR